MQKCMIVILLMIQHGIAFAQVPKVGKPMPDFVLDDIYHYDKAKVSLADFKGKWLFLDFWYRGCTSCIKSFPKINNLQREFKDKVQFVLVGTTDVFTFGDGIKPLYERLRRHRNLDLAAAFDSTLRQKWDISAFPHIIIVNPEGIVVAITPGTDLTKEKVQDLIDGKKVSFQPGRAEQPVFDAVAAIQDTSETLAFRSVLTKWRGEQVGIWDIRDWAMEKNILSFEAYGATLSALYKVAYIGRGIWSQYDTINQRIYPFPILEMKDTSLFAFDFGKKQGIYNYDLYTFRKKTAAEMMAIMQQELKHIFGYDVSFEERIVPVWKLVAKPGALKKLKTKNGKPGYLWDATADSGAGGFGYNNWSIGHLLQLCMRYISDNEPPYFDETGITDNIDVKMEVDMTDFNAIRKGLQRYDLDLVKGERMMTVMVLRDKK